MTQDEIIDMATEVYGETVWSEASLARLQQFVKLVAAKEREACAKDAEWCIQNHLEHLMPERIRARGEQA